MRGLENLERPRWWWTRRRRTAWLAAKSLELGKPFRACKDCRFFSSIDMGNQSKSECWALVKQSVKFNVTTGKMYVEYSNPLNAWDFRTGRYSGSAACGEDGIHWKPLTRYQWLRRMLIRRGLPLLVVLTILGLWLK